MVQWEQLVPRRFQVHILVVSLIVLAAGCVQLRFVVGLVGVSDRFGRDDPASGGRSRSVGARVAEHSLAFLYTSSPIDPVKAQAALLWSRRAAEVREAVRHAWTGYQMHAYQADDLKPVSRTGHDWMNARATFYDSLDTLHIAGLEREFEAAVAEISPSVLNLWSPSIPTSVIYPLKTFEYHIRVVGGLLGAFMVSGRRHLLHSARRAADCVLAAFDEPAHPPRRFIRIAHPRRTPLLWGLAAVLDGIRMTYDPMVWSNTLSGIGTFSLELRVLSRETGDPKYRAAAARLQRVINKEWNILGRPARLPMWWSTPPPSWASRYFRAPTASSVSYGRRVGLGSGGDSFYEYLVKNMLIGDDGEGASGSEQRRGDGEMAVGSEPWSTMGSMYDAFVSDAATPSSRVLYYPPRRPRRSNSTAARARNADGAAATFASVTEGDGPAHQTHLACFGGGLLGLGARFLGGHASDIGMARSVTEMCADAYAATPTGLGPESMRVEADGSLRKTSSRSEQRYHLRPETIESLFVLYRTTGDERYRERGWELFQAIQRHCRVDAGYVGLKSVWRVPDGDPANMDDYMPSFFIGETLKYFFLLFSDDDLIPLEDWVFNTEAHPFSRSARCGSADAGTQFRGGPCTGAEHEAWLAMLPWDLVGVLTAAVGLRCVGCACTCPCGRRWSGHCSRTRTRLCLRL